MSRKRSLTPDQLPEIKRLIAMGVPQTRIARDYGMAYRTLWEYLKADKKKTKEKGGK